MASVKKETPNYLLIGIFLFIGLVLIVIGVIISDKLFYKIKGGYVVQVVYDNIDGIGVGSKIMVGSGKEIGQVDAIDLEDARLIVSIRLDKNFRINQDASFQIFSSSLVGGKFIEVVNYTGREPHIKEGSRIQGTNPFSINQIFALFSAVGADGSTNDLDLTGVLNSVTGMLATANRILIDNETNVSAMFNNLSDASRRLNIIMANLDRKVGAISDAQFNTIIKDLETSISELSVFLSDINKPNAPLSLLKDPAMNHSLRTIITNLEYTTERVKRQPSLLLK
ncbi:MAG: MlaD family protein [Brevinema sp.]